ncbi:hypothetical protein D3C80_1295450 [compost metagenome]
MITQARFGHQALVFPAQAGLARAPAVGAEVELPISEAIEPGWCLQFPILPTGLDSATGQATAPVAFVQVAVKTQVELELRPLQRQLQLLLAKIALAFGV